VSNEYKKSQWNDAFLCAANLAGDDPQRCVALNRQMLFVNDLVAQLTNQSKQDGFVGVGDSGLSQDRLLNGDIGGDAEGNPSQVA
jgi:hypothetical protein